MSGKATYQQLVKQLQEFSAASVRRRSKEVDKKEKAMIIYRRMQMKKAGKVLTPEADKQLVAAIKAKFTQTVPTPDTSMLAYLDSDSLGKIDANHAVDITTFLRSQRVYEELLERYNPGISMLQTDKVQKTANRVGLEVPE